MEWSAMMQQRNTQIKHTETLRSWRLQHNTIWVNDLIENWHKHDPLRSANLRLSCVWERKFSKNNNHKNNSLCGAQRIILRKARNMKQMSRCTLKINKTFEMWKAETLKTQKVKSKQSIYKPSQHDRQTTFKWWQTVMLQAWFSSMVKEG